MTRWDYGQVMRPRLKPGQQELRDNLRVALAESGRSQSAVCCDAGLVMYNLHAILGGQSWATPERVDAFAEALGLSPDELLGASMYKGESWLDARRRQGGVDWRPCPSWCWSADDHDEGTQHEIDGRPAKWHYGTAIGHRWGFRLHYFTDTGEEADRHVALHPNPDAVDTESEAMSYADLASIATDAQRAAAWLRGEVILP